MCDKNLGIQNDIQNELEKANHINQLILDSVAEGIYGIDLQANVVFWNKAAENLTGYLITDFAYSNLHDLIHHTNKDGQHVPLTDCPVFHALTNGESMFIEDDIFWHKNGTSFPVEYTVKPMLEKGKHVGTVITFRDVTERKKTEQLLQEWEQLAFLAQMSAGIAHEIRNPLTSLKGFMQLIKSNKQWNEHYFDIMDMEFNRIESIIKELLTFSKPQLSDYKEVNIKELLDQVIVLMQPQAIMKNITIESLYESPFYRMECIEHQVKQVFINIVKNAIEAMHKSGKITIGLRKDQEEYEITVTDEGPGMTQETIDRLGEPFFTTKKEGTGLGLMVTNNIIKNQHQGSLQIKSEVNKGTQFIIRFPEKACLR